ncbi:TIGR03086 family metal-binding protein [Catellatospora coxensis]|uniref:TIGR03086 family protein n=1 Tax=Catellatospora coxensis TaxID=310354 RepID=A0A8J3L644_9ACTN|nr:TIGR03086 family metal-binding protein [Catellatospora coxensis]GIG09216.1 TIGR03086 family protein [Catellatospora coxensis]
MDLLNGYRASLAEFTDRVAQVRPEQWTSPTPCTEWDVRSLVNHLVGEDRWTVPIFAGATIDDVGDRFAGDLLGADPVAAAADAAREAEAAVTAPGAMDRIVHLSFGDTAASEYAYQLTADHLVHAWDLAVALGVDPQLDPQAVRVVADWFDTEEHAYRGAGVIGPRIDLPDGSDPQDRLLAAFGRDPAWAPD